jgi:hypothetical protein
VVNRWSAAQGRQTLGHTDIAITAEFYDATVEEMRAAMESIARREIPRVEAKLVERKSE